MSRRSLLAFGVLGILASVAIVVLLGTAADARQRTSYAADVCAMPADADLVDGALGDAPRVRARLAPQLVDVIPPPPRAPRPPVAAALTTAPKTSPPG